jgi:glycine/D-amino acid oxidase-like deaminating enzyme
MIKTEFIIVGQGISGTFLSWYLHKAGLSFVVIDHFDRFSSSWIAAGIINPVTGRRIVKTWMIETLLPFAENAYRDLGLELGISTMNRKKMIDFFPSPQMLNAFSDRLKENDQFLSLPTTESSLDKHFNYDFGYGEIDYCYMVNMKDILHSWRMKLLNNSNLIEEKFDEKLLTVNENNVQYKDLSAEKIIFCDGIYSSRSKYFQNLPFALNKGEALIIESDSIPGNNIYKKGITLAPLKDNLFWAGSSHEWNFTDNLPSQQFLERTRVILKEWLKEPFVIKDHVASIRPATVERRPFVGMHPHYPLIGILNGMGTKGCSLSPYFADQLVKYFTQNTPILPEADIKRFSRILNSSY